MIDTIVVVDSGQTYETTESAIVAKEEADRAEKWAAYAEDKANLSEQSALESAKYRDEAKQISVEAEESSEESRKWAVGTIEEREEGSSKYWAEQAAESAASVDGGKIKRIAYENIRLVYCSGETTVILQDTDEIIKLNITDNSTISFDLSTLTYSKAVYTVQIYAVFPNGVKTISLSATPSISWINGTTPDFSSGKSHWLVLRHTSGDTFVLMSDAGEVA